MILLSSFSKNDLKYLCLVEWPALETYSLLYSELDKITFLLFKNVHVTNWQSPTLCCVVPDNSNDALLLFLQCQKPFKGIHNLHTHTPKQANKQTKKTSQWATISMILSSNNICHCFLPLQYPNLHLKLIERTLRKEI